MALNPTRIKSKILKAIQQAPIYFDLYRYPLVDNGIGGKSRASEPILVQSNVMGLLDNSSHSGIQHLAKAFGVKSQSEGTTLYVVYDDAYNFIEGDMFTLHGDKYIITEAVDILDLHIYWELELSKDEDATEIEGDSDDETW